MAATVRAPRTKAPAKPRTPRVPKQNATAVLLDAVCELLDRYIVFPSAEARDAVALWILHTHVAPAFESTPRLVLLSRDPGSGKSRVLEVASLLVANPRMVASIQEATMWRMIDESAETNPPTILFDEADTTFGTSGSSSARQGLRGIINEGHRRHGTVPRCAPGGKGMIYFRVFAPVAMAGLGTMPRTILTRSVVITMEQRSPDQKVEPFRERLAFPLCEPVKQALTQWALTAALTLSTAYPDLPVTDRNADVWEPLVSVADLAGSAWGKRARGACLALIEKGKKEIPSSGQLLKDVRAIFEQTKAKTLFTADLLEHLHNVDGGRWEQLAEHGLGAALRQFEMQSRTVRKGPLTAKGYRLADLPPVKVVEVPAEPA